MEQYLETLLLCALAVFWLSGCSGKTEPQNEKMPAETIVAESATEAPVAADVPSFYGTWYIWDDQPASISTLSADKIEELSKHRITYADNSVPLDGEVFDTNGYNYGSEQYTCDQILEGYNVNLGAWWSEIEYVSSVAVSAEDDFFGKDFFVAGDDAIWIYYGGVFFHARQESLP